jgi:hypothetical protein
VASIASRPRLPLHAADLNGDGLMDLYSQSQLRPYLNTGTDFIGTEVPTNHWDWLHYPLAFADFDSDGDLDIFCRPGPQANLPSLTGTIRWNGGQDVWSTEPASFFLAPEFGGAASDDFDNDGDLDLMVTGDPSFGAGTRLYENLGAGRFAIHPASFPYFGRGFCSWADYDSDGDADVLLSGINRETILYRNDEGHLMDSGHRFTVRGARNPLNQNSVFADFDNDADLDLVLVGTVFVNSSRPRGFYYRNDSTNFAEIPLTLTNLADPAEEVHAADLDNDGFLDLVIPQLRAAAGLLLNNRAGGFLPSRPLRSIVGHLTLIDVDGDSRIDLISAPQDLPVQLHKNLTAATNSAPSAPGNLSSAPTSNSVSLTWSASVDQEQTNGLTYNLRIGTAPGKSDVLSAMASAVNNQRLVRAIGNTGLRTNWTIGRLAAGTYYWSVQTIDHGFRASAFAPEQSFVISNTAPLVQTFAVTNISCATAVLAGEVHALKVPTVFYAEVITPGGSWFTEFSSINDPSLSQHVYIAIKDLTDGKNYSARLIASNQFGISYGSVMSFKTPPLTPLSEIKLSAPSFFAPPRIMPVDYDQDSDLDILAIPGSAVRAVKMRNENGTFVEDGYLDYPTLRTGSIPWFGDINNDSQLDYVATESRFIVYGGADWLTQTNAISYNSKGQPALADIDNDGDLDLVSASDRNPYELSHFLNNGLPTLQLSAFRAPGQSVRAGDYDNDGDNDLLVWGRTNSAIFQSVAQIIPNAGRGSFAPPRVLQLAHDADWADFDNDGDLDIILAWEISSFPSLEQVELLWNNSTNGFSTQTLLSAEYLVSVHPIDFDRDGAVDLFVRDASGSTSKFRFFKNQGNGQFIETDLGLPVFDSFAPAIADFDGDSMPDLLLAASTPLFSGHHLRLFRNNLTATNAVPQVPTNLTVLVGRMSATLLWNLPDNVERTNSFKNSFNVRIGKTPGGSEIMSAMSHRVSGAQSLPMRGNAGQSGAWTIRALPPGTYHWSVQSIDHAFNTSTFAPEATFTIAPYERPPKILSMSLSPADSHYYLNVDGPTRSHVQLQSSSDLVSWQQIIGRIDIGEDSVHVDIGSLSGQHRFYRLQLLD